MNETPREMMDRLMRDKLSQLQSRYPERYPKE